MEATLTEKPDVFDSGSEHLPQEDKPTILVVDDSPLAARLAAGIIRKSLDMRVLFASDGVEALETIQLQRPNVVLTDLLMPRMDGLELVHEVVSTFPNIPVILMTASGSEQIATQALQTGASSYVPKSVLHEQLPAVLEQVIAAGRAERRRRQFLEGLKEFHINLSLGNDTRLVPFFISYAQEHLAGLNLCDTNGRIRAGVALEEAMVNGMHHGNLGLSSKLKESSKDEYIRTANERLHQHPYKSRKLHVSVTMTPAEAVFVFRDEGPGFDVSKVPDPTDPENLLRPSGRGLLLIRTFMSEVSFNDKGNEITLVHRPKNRAVQN